MKATETGNGSVLKHFDSEKEELRDFVQFVSFYISAVAIFPIYYSSVESFGIFCICYQIFSISI